MKQIIFLCLIASCHHAQAMQWSDYNDFIEDISMEQEKRFIDNEFTEVFANPTIKNVGKIIPTLPSDYIEKMKKSDQNRSLFIAIASVPQEVLHCLFGEHMFEGNEEIENKFYDRPYGKAMLSLAFAIDAVKQRPEGFLTLNNCFGISPALRNLYTRVNKNFEWDTHDTAASMFCKSWPRVTLYEQELIQEEMPKEIVKLLAYQPVLLEIIYHEPIGGILDGIYGMISPSSKHKKRWSTFTIIKALYDHKIHRN